MPTSFPSTDKGEMRRNKAGGRAAKEIKPETLFKRDSQDQMLRADPKLRTGK